MNRSQESSKQNDSVMQMVKPFLFGVIVSILSSMILILLFSFILTLSTLPDTVSGIIIYVILAFASFIGAYMTAKMRKKKGLVSGIITAFCFFILILLAGFAGSTTMGFNQIFVIKLVLTMAAGGVGGYAGVSGKRKK